MNSNLNFKVVMQNKNLVAESTYNCIKNLYNEDEQKQFFELSDKEKKLLEKPENSDKTLMELYEVYFNKKMYKLFDNIPKKKNKKLLKTAATTAATIAAFPVMVTLELIKKS